jgi:predicted ATP-binding protein involved in virulence
VEWLRGIFSNLQFIVATHSPFVTIGAGEDALTIKCEITEDTGEVNIKYIENISNYDVDQVLRSPAFNLVSTYSTIIQKKIEQYHQLRFRFMESHDLNETEQKLLTELTELMRRINSAGIPPEPGSLLDRMTRFLEEKLPQ